MENTDRGLNHLTDRLYSADDMASLGSYDCKGCSSCCYDMDGLFLDPMDMYFLTAATNKTFTALLDNEIALDYRYGLILPKMKMDSERNSCHFLNKDGRCSIHECRPGICRAFPLGRNYEEGTLSYFLLRDECKVSPRYKVKISKWIGISDYPNYHRFLLDWYAFCKESGGLISNLTKESAGQVLTFILKLFYETPYRSTDFYPEFYERMERAKNALSLE